MFNLYDDVKIIIPPERRKIIYGIVDKCPKLKIIIPVLSEDKSNSELNE